MTANQRSQGAGAVNVALDSELIEEVISRQVIQDYNVRGEFALFVGCEFASDVAGQRIFSTVRSWAQGRAEDAASGRPSLVSLVTVDQNADTWTRWMSTSPTWPDLPPEVRNLREDAP